MPKTKIREITIEQDKGAFSLFRKSGTSNKDYDFEGLSSVRNLLSNEKARLLHTVKSKEPKSVYELAKLLKRDFKSVNGDIKLLERFGFIDLISEKTGNRERLRPKLVVESINIEIKV